MMILLIGCREIESFSPEQVMQNAMETKEDTLDYYGEQTMTMTDIDDTFTMEVKEWRSGDKSLEEVTAENEVMVTLMEGKNVSFYDEAENTVYHTDLDEQASLDFNAQEQVEDILELVKDTHDIKNEGEEEIAGRPTVHIVATKRKGEKSLYGTHEMWIDKENWLVLKTVSNTGDNKVEMEYTKIDFDSKLDDDVFTLDVPDDATVEMIDDEIETDEDITLEEGAEKLGTTYKYMKEKDDISIDSVSYIELTDDVSLQNVNIDYHHEGLPFMTLSIYLDEVDRLSDEDIEEDELTQHLILRGQDAELFEMDDTRMLSWSEEGLDYTLTIIHPSYPLEDIKELVEEMEEVSS